MTDLGYDVEKIAYKKVLYPKLSSVNTLYDLDVLDRSKTLYAVEGLMDLIALRTCGEFKNSTAYFGNQLTQRQLFLFDRFSRIVVIPDRDKAGMMTLKKLQSHPSLKNKVGVLFLPSKYKDPNKVIQEGDTIQSLLDKNWLTKIHDLTDVSIDSIS